MDGSSQSTFDFSQRLDPVIAPSLPLVERVRLSRQCAAILARLERGPATNRELAAMALNYRARISELRQLRIQVVVLARDHASGRTLYGIREGV